MDGWREESGSRLICRSPFGLLLFGCRWARALSLSHTHSTGLLFWERSDEKASSHTESGLPYVLK